MNTNEKLLWGALAGIAVLIPVVLAVGTGSPWYLLLIVVLLAGVGVLRFYLTAQQERPPAAAPAPTPEPREPEPWSQEAVTEIELPTTRPDYPMVFSARVIWQPVRQQVGEPPHADLAAVARHAVVERAATFVGDRAPSDLDVARSALAAQLGVVQPDPTGRIRAQATDVALDLRADDADRLRAEADRRKSGVAWQQERERERDVMEYLHGDVLTSPGRALVWWLSQHPDDIQGAVDRVGQLTRLSAVSQGRDDPNALGPQLVPPPGMRPPEHRDLTATRDLLLQLIRLGGPACLLRPGTRSGRRRVRAAEVWPTRPPNLRIVLPHPPEAAPYSEDRAPPDPEDEPPYSEDTEPPPRHRSTAPRVVIDSSVAWRPTVRRNSQPGPLIGA